MSLWSSIVPILIIKGMVPDIIPNALKTERNLVFLLRVRRTYLQRDVVHIDRRDSIRTIVVNAKV